MTKATPEAINALIDAKNVADKAAFDTSSAKLRLDIAALDWSVPVITPPVIDPPPVVIPPVTGTNPGGKSSNPVSYSNLNNQTITGLSFDGGGKSVDLITLNNCNNIHITLCRFSNTNGYSISLNNCQNITIDFNFFNMVNFGVHAENCIGTKVNNNQGLNLWGPVLYKSNFAHWVQFHNCSGSGQQINNNKFENVLGVAVHPHDHISVDNCSGTAASPIQINGNWLRGGQSSGGWPNSGDTGGGIMAPDEAGTYIEVKNNIMVMPGCAGIQAIGSGSNVVLDGNVIYNPVKNAVFMNAISVSGAKTNFIITNNRSWVINKNGVSAIQSDNEPYLYMNHATTMPGVTIKGNTWADKTLSASILPDQIITYK